MAAPLARIGRLSVLKANTESRTWPVCADQDHMARAGSHSLDWNSDIGAVWIYAEASDITAPVVLRDLQVNDSTHQGLLLSWQRPVSGLTLERVAFNGTGTIGMEFNSPGTGSFSYVTLTGNGGPALANNAGFVINRGPGNSGF